MLRKFPTVKPAFWLDFENSGLALPGFSVTRPTAADYLDYSNSKKTAAIDVPRFGGIVPGKGSQGLLVESTSTNKWLYSEEFNSAYWEVTQATGAQASFSDASFISVVENGAFASPTCRRRLGQKVPASQAFALQAIVRPGARRFLAIVALLRPPGATLADEKLSSIKLDTLTGQWVAGSATIPNSIWHIVKLPNGDIWVGFSGVNFNSEMDLSSYFDFRATDATAFADYSSTGKSFQTTSNAVSYSLSFAQFEYNRGPTSYMKTVASEVTRSNDLISLNLALSNNEISPSAGTIYVNAGHGSGVIWQLGPNGSNRYFLEYQNTTKGAGRMMCNIDAVTQFGKYSPNISGKTVFAYDSNGFDFIDGDGIIHSGPASLLPTFGMLRLGNSGSDTYQLNGVIKQFGYYGQRLSVAQMKALVGK